MLLELARWINKFRVFSKYIRFLHALVAVWLVYVFHSYLPALTATLHLRLIDQHLRRSGAYDVLLVLWFTAVAYCAGRRLLRLLGVSPASGAEVATFSIAAGVSVFSLFTMILALLHGLYRPVAYALLLVPTLLWLPEMQKLSGNLWRAMAAKVRGARWSMRAFAQGFLAAYIVVVLAIVLLSALGPSYEYDDLTYHLAGPKNFMQRHRLVPLPDSPLAFLPKNMEMLFTLGLLWHCDITAKLLHFMLGVVAMAAAYAFSARFFSRTAGMVAAVILASSPLFIWEMRTAHNDVGLALYVFVGAYAASLWLWTGGAPWLRLAALFLAFSVGIKYWALLALGVTALLVFGVRVKQTRAVLPAAGSAFRLGLYSALGLLPWGMINPLLHRESAFPSAQRGVPKSLLDVHSHGNDDRTDPQRRRLDNAFELVGPFCVVVEVDGGPACKLGR